VKAKYAVIEHKTYDLRCFYSRSAFWRGCKSIGEGSEKTSDIPRQSHHSRHKAWHGSFCNEVSVVMPMTAVAKSVTAITAIMTAVIILKTPVLMGRKRVILCLIKNIFSYK